MSIHTVSRAVNWHTVFVGQFEIGVRIVMLIIFDPTVLLLRVYFINLNKFKNYVCICNIVYVVKKKKDSLFISNSHLLMFLNNMQAYTYHC